MNYRTFIPYGSNILIKCPNCLYEGEPKKKRKGNLIIEILLRFLIVPGIIYTIWRGINSICMCPRCKAIKLEEKNGEGELIDKLIKINKGEKIIFWLVFIIFFMGSFLVWDKFERNNIVSVNNEESLQNNAKSNNSIWNFGNYNYNQVQNNFKIDVESAINNKGFMTNKADTEEDKMRKFIANELIQEANHRGPKGYIPLEGFLGLECVGDCLNLHVLLKTTTEPEEKFGQNNLTLFGKQLSSSIYWKLQNWIYDIDENIKKKAVGEVDILINDKLSYICLCKQGLDCNKCIDVKKLDKFSGDNIYNEKMIKTILYQFSQDRKEDLKFLKAYCNGSCLSGDINVDYVDNITTGYPNLITDTAKQLASEVHFILRRYVDLPISVHIRGGEEIKLTCTASNGELAVCS